MKIKFSDFGRCLVCCCSPCRCTKKKEAMSDQTWWKKELYGNVCGIDESKVILSDIKMYERLEDLAERIEAAAEARGAEDERSWILENCSGGGDWRRKIIQRLSPTQGSSSQPSGGGASTS